MMVPTHASKDGLVCVTKRGFPVENPESIVSAIDDSDRGHGAEQDG
jgi:hypothetical protein